MADLEFRFNIKYAQGSVTVERNPGTQEVSVTGDKAIHNVQEIGTSAENLQLGDIGTPGYAVFHNLDDTNIIRIGYDDTGFKHVIELDPGEWSGPVRLSQATPQAIALVAACDLEYIIIED